MLLDKIPHVVADTFGDVDSQNIADFCTRFALLIQAEEKAVVGLTVFDDVPLCSGWEYTNDIGALYVHHSSSDDCPLHGMGKDGRGARVYVGKKQVKREDACFAIWDYKRMVIARQRLAAVRSSLQIIRAGLSSLAADYRQFEFDF